MIEDELPDAPIGRMVATGTYWAPTLELWQRVGLPSKQPVINLGRFVAAGGQVALGTDYAGYAAQFDLTMPMTEIELMANADADTCTAHLRFVQVQVSSSQRQRTRRPSAAWAASGHAGTRQAG